MSGTNTPPDGTATPPTAINEHIQQLLRSTFNALELWKQVWDADLAIQFPQNQRRHGFCRDGVHFYYLAQIFLRNSRPQEWAAPADLRCRQVFHLLKQIRGHVASDSAQKGIDLGSLNKIADDYCLPTKISSIEDLTLNMRRLFAPLEDPEPAARPDTLYTWAQDPIPFVRATKQGVSQPPSPKQPQHRIISVPSQQTSSTLSRHLQLQQNHTKPAMNSLLSNYVVLLRFAFTSESRSLSMDHTATSIMEFSADILRFSFSSEQSEKH
jgi:hypothetical protein